MPEITSSKLSINPNLLPRAARVVDVGCGDGRHLRAAAARGCTTIGVDCAIDELKHARGQLAAHGSRLTAHFIAADAAHLPFRDAMFDAAICTETLEHLTDDVAAACEIARVLADGSPLLGAVPSHFTERLYWSLSRGYRDTPGGHVRIYAPHALIDTLRGAGLRVTAVRYAHFVDSLVWLRFCLTDFLRPARPKTGFEAAVLLAVAAERPVAPWRATLRRAIVRSRFIAALDALGALLWPKSLLFTAQKSPIVRTTTSITKEGSRVASGAGAHVILSEAGHTIAPGPMQTPR
jgi:SAM-dependent methyltransferase